MSATESEESRGQENLGGRQKRERGRKGQDYDSDKHDFFDDSDPDEGTDDDDLKTVTILLRFTRQHVLVYLVLTHANVVPNKEEPKEKHLWVLSLNDLTGCRQVGTSLII